MKNVSHKYGTENKNTRFAVNNFFKKSCGLSDNVENNVDPDRPQCALRAA